MRTWIVLVPSIVLGGSFARATDRVVDAQGVASNLTHIDQAMVISAPGDRILVMPGSYPTFFFNRGVQVIGLGRDPSQVQVAQVDFHPNIPSLGYDAVLSNLTVCGGAGHGTPVSGNELGPGTLVIEAADICGGVYLRGAGEFYLMMVDTQITASPGDGFQNTALQFGGGVADIVDSEIRGAEGLGQPAGAALRIGGGAVVRLSGTRVIGGSGNEGFHGGADAIDRGFGAAPVKLRLSGASEVRGGDALGFGPGGAGVDLVGTIHVGDAQVLGGLGGTLGTSYAASKPIELGFDPHLSLQPASSGGSPSTPGGGLSTLLLDPSLGAIRLGAAMRIDPPTTASHSPLVPGSTLYWPQGSVAGRFQFPPQPQHRRVYVQAFYLDPKTLLPSTTNPIPVSWLP